MLMSSIDLISKRGMKVGAAIDLGGGAPADRVREAVRVVLLDERISCVYINIFGGITRCNEVAEGIRSAMALQPAGRTVIARLEGTNKEEGLAILASVPGVSSVDGLLEGVEALHQAPGAGAASRTGREI
jgi:succinyl-CoA synthetase beta subunit